MSIFSPSDSSKISIERNEEEPRNLLVYVNNPLEFEKLVYKKVKIHVKNKHAYEGYVKTIDPVSESVVLVNIVRDQPSKVQIILGHAIERVEIIEDNRIEYEELLRNTLTKRAVTKSAEELNSIKSNVKSWLLKNRFPVTENEDASLTVAGVLKVLPPYDASSCLCENEIILGKIQGLIAAIPDNVDEWDQMTS